MPVSEAQKKASAKYRKNNLEEVRFWVHKGEKAKIASYAEKKGMTLSSYMKDLIQKDMEGTT